MSIISRALDKNVDPKQLEKAGPLKKEDGKKPTRETPVNSLMAARSLKPESRNAPRRPPASPRPLPSREAAPAPQSLTAKLARYAAPIIFIGAIAIGIGFSIGDKIGLDRKAQDTEVVSV